MKGAIIGDIVGSVYEFHNIKTKAFPLWSPAGKFTDDSVMTVAVAMALIEGTDDRDRLLDAVTDYMHDYGNRYRSLRPRRAHGGPDPQPSRILQGGRRDVHAHLARQTRHAQRPAP